LALGLSGFLIIGLVFGQILGQLAGVFVMLIALVRSSNKKIFESLSLVELLRLAKRYIRFPIYSLPADTLNALATYLPFFILGKYYGPHVVGLYLMTQRITYTPIALIANSVSDVFKERATQDFREVGSCRPLLMKTFLILFAISLPPSLVLLFFGPQLFSFVLGDEWTEAGSYASIMAPLLAVRFAVSSVGFVLYISEKQKVDFFWQATLLAVSSAALLTGVTFWDVKMSIMFLSYSCLIMYLIYLAISYYYAKSNNIAPLNGNIK
jgi:O-antigen/teichoic acid export membrane protein